MKNWIKKVYQNTTDKEWKEAMNQEFHFIDFKNPNPAGDDAGTNTNK